MQPGGAVLAALRARPEMAISAWGFIVRGAMLANAVGGPCALQCARYGQSSIYQIDVGAGAGDWYIPYHHGQARHCDVPQGQPDGTLVVTFPMNGCAREVREDAGSNRFYHDADAISMPGHPPGVLKIRITPQDYEGASRTAHMRSLRYFAGEVQMARETPNTGGYEHTIISVKRGGNWQVYGSANMRLNGDGWQIKDNVPTLLGTFAD